VEWFRTRREAQIIIEAWRQHYNAVRPHSSIGYLTPFEFKQHHSLSDSHKPSHFPGINGSKNRTQVTSASVADAQVDVARIVDRKPAARIEPHGDPVSLPL
jgi:hypothetical protein